MAGTVDFYPPSPAHVPPDLTKPTRAYRLRVAVVLTSLILFVVLYVGLVAGTAYLSFYSFATRGSAAAGRQQLDDIVRSQEQITRVYNDAVTSARQGQIDDGRLLQIIEQDVLPRWRAGQQRLAQVKGLGADEQRFAEGYGRYLRAREEAWELLARALHEDARHGLSDPPQVVPSQTLGGTAGRPWPPRPGMPNLPGRRARPLVPMDPPFQPSAGAARQPAQPQAPNPADVLVAQANQKNAEAELLAQRVNEDAASLASRSARSRDNEDFWMIVLGIASGVLCLFLVKGFFKWRKAEESKRMEVTEKVQPDLFAFIRRLCGDTRAPFPHRVFLAPDVNAAVFYNESLLSLVLPTPKNLLIGLGLVNRLNLTEFKAVLAHEFGHFSQNSMKLGTYVYTANRIIGDLVFGRDWLDGVVSFLRRLDIRIAAFAWAFTGLLWAVRKTLQGLFRLINFANTSLSRQMEFNADLVAVSVTGSDALVNGLARLDLAGEALGQAWNDLSVAADHGLYTRDLFYHQTKAAEYLRAVRKDPNLGEPPVLPADPTQTVQVFEPEDTSVPKMWATHPSNRDREVNAKQHYVRSPIDGRSPWVLFHDAAGVREQMTRRLYEAARPEDKIALQAPETVQAFIDEEHAETTYHPRYHGLYDGRYLTPGDLDELLRHAASTPADPAGLTTECHRLYGDDVKDRMEAHRARQQEHGLLAGLAEGAVALKAKDFQFRGARRRAGDAGKLLTQVRKEIDEDYEWMSALDRRAFLVHHAMACRLGEAERAKLEARYRFHLGLQEIHGRVSAHQRNVQETLGPLMGKRELSQGEFQGAIAALRAAREALVLASTAAGGLCLPALKNVTAGAPLGSLLFTKPLPRPLGDEEKSLDGAWIGQLMEQIGEVREKAGRLHFKSLGGILALQERIAERGAASDPLVGNGPGAGSVPADAAEAAAENP